MSAALIRRCLTLLADSAGQCAPGAGHRPCPRPRRGSESGPVMSAPMTRDEVLRIVREAQGRGERPNLSGADLTRADLTRANLSGANLSEANLTRANLSGADLTRADLTRANLRWADLTGADLTRADLTRANLRWADLRWANLRWANLRWANLRWADLTGASGGVLAIDGLPSGSARLAPTPDGWSLRVGCWVGTVEALRTLIAGTDWPEAEGDEQDRRRPGLAAVADLCDAHAAANPDLIADLAKHWGTDKAMPA